MTLEEALAKIDALEVPFSLSKLPRELQVGTLTLALLEILMADLSQLTAAFASLSTNTQSLQALADSQAATIVTLKAQIASLQAGANSDQPGVDQVTASMNTLSTAVAATVTKDTPSS